MSLSEVLLIAVGGAGTEQAPGSWPVGAIIKAEIYLAQPPSMKVYHFCKMKLRNFSQQSTSRQANEVTISRDVETTRAMPRRRNVVFRFRECLFHYSQDILKIELFHRELSSLFNFPKLPFAIGPHKKMKKDQKWCKSWKISRNKFSPSYYNKFSDNFYFPNGTTFCTEL